MACEAAPQLLADINAATQAMMEALYASSADACEEAVAERIKLLHVSPAPQVRGFVGVWVRGG